MTGSPTARRSTAFSPARAIDDEADAAALAAGAALVLSACGGGGGEACANAAAADKTVHDFREDVKAAKTSVTIPSDKLAGLEKKLAELTKPGEAVPGGNIKEACPGLRRSPGRVRTAPALLVILLARSGEI